MQDQMVRNAGVVITGASLINRGNRGLARIIHFKVISLHLQVNPPRLVTP